MSPFTDHITRMAAYNAWANDRILTAVAALPPECLWQERGAFFGSIMGTLNHLLVGDRVWLARMTSQPYDWFTGLDQILHRDFSDFASVRRAQDRTISDTVPTLPSDGTLSYINSKGQPQCTPWGVVLTHLFNHQTHHRAQVHTLISQCGGEAPVLDLLYFAPAA